MGLGRLSGRRRGRHARRDRATDALRLAVLLSLLCVAAVLVQFGYAFLGTDLLALKGPSSAIFPAIIVLLAIAQWIYARWLRRRGALR